MTVRAPRNRAHQSVRFIFAMVAPGSRERLPSEPMGASNAWDSGDPTHRGLPLRFWQRASQQTGGKLPLKQQLILFNREFSRNTWSIK